MSRKSSLLSYFRRFFQLFSKGMEDDNQDEFPVGSREVCDFERALTALYSTSSYARERRPKNVVRSITCYKEKSGPRHEYLVVKVINHNGNAFTSLRLERTRIENPDFTNSSKSLLPVSSPGVEITPGSHEVADTPGRPEQLHRRNSSTPSNQKSKSYFGGFPAMDIIQVFGNHEKVKDVDHQEIIFTNDDFTLHDLSMIAKVVHDVRTNYHLQEAQCYWFAAVVVEVAMSSYEWTRAEHSPTSSKLGKLHGISFLDVFWGANVKDSVDTAIPLFRQLQAANGEKIKGANNAAEAVSQSIALAREAEEAKTKAKKAEQEAEQAQREAQRSQELTDQVIRESQAKDVEIARLQRELTPNVVQRTIKHGS